MAGSIPTPAAPVDLARRVQLVAQQFPFLAEDPDVLVGIARSASSDEEAIDRAVNALSFSTLERWKDRLASLPSAHQRGTWSSLTPRQQNLLAANGYRPPPEPHDPWAGGLLGDALAVGGRVLGTGLNIGTKALGTLGGPLLHGLIVAGDQPSHLYRTGQAVFDEVRDDRRPQTGLSTLLHIVTNPSQWWDAWWETGDGNDFVRQGAQDKALEILGGNASYFSLAKDLSAGATIEELATRAGDPGTVAYQEAYGQIVRLATEDKAFGDALTTLNQGKVSVGRDFARSFGLSPGSLPHTLVSGSVDAAFLIAFDPTLQAGKAFKAWRFARYGINIADRASTVARVDELAANPNVRRVWDDIASYVSAGRYRDLGRRYNDLMPLLRALERYHHTQRPLHSADDVAAFFKDETTMHALLGGQATTYHSGHIVMPHVTRAGYHGRRLKVWMGEVIDFLSEDAVLVRGLDADDVATVGFGTGFDATGPLGARVERQRVNPFGTGVAGRLADAYRTSGLAHTPLGKLVLPIAPAAQLVKGFTTHVPRGGSISLFGRDAVPELDRLVDLGVYARMPRHVRDMWWETIFQAGSDADRILAVRGFLDELFELTGVNATEAGAEWGKRFTARIGQAYAEGVERMANGQLAAIWPDADRAFELPLPSLRDLQAQSTRLTLTRRLFGATANHKMTDAFMGTLWRPAVLLRIGFIPRAAGEELLSFLMRVPVLEYPKTFALRAVAEGEVARDAAKRLYKNRLRARLHAAPRLEPTGSVRGASRATAREVVEGFVDETDLARLVDDFFRADDWWSEANVDRVARMLGERFVHLTDGEVQELAHSMAKLVPKSLRHTRVAEMTVHALAHPDDLEGRALRALARLANRVMNFGGLAHTTDGLEVMTHLATRWYSQNVRTLLRSALDPADVRAVKQMMEHAGVQTSYASAVSARGASQLHYERRARSELETPAETVLVGNRRDQLQEKVLVHVNGAWEHHTVSDPAFAWDVHNAWAHVVSPDNAVGVALADEASSFVGPALADALFGTVDAGTTRVAMPAAERAAAAAAWMDDATKYLAARIDDLVDLHPEILDDVLEALHGDEEAWRRMIGVLFPTRPGGRTPAPATFAALNRVRDDLVDVLAASPHVRSWVAHRLVTARRVADDLGLDALTARAGERFLVFDQMPGVVTDLDQLHARLVARAQATLTDPRLAADYRANVRSRMTSSHAGTPDGWWVVDAPAEGETLAYMAMLPGRAIHQLERLPADQLEALLRRHLDDDLVERLLVRNADGQVVGLDMEGVRQAAAARQAVASGDATPVVLAAFSDPADARRFLDDLRTTLGLDPETTPTSLGLLRMTDDETRRVVTGDATSGSRQTIYTSSSGRQFRLDEPMRVADVEPVPSGVPLRQVNGQWVAGHTSEEAVSSWSAAAVEHFLQIFGMRRGAEEVASDLSYRGMLPLLDDVQRPARRAAERVGDLLPGLADDELIAGTRPAFARLEHVFDHGPGELPSSVPAKKMALPRDGWWDRFVRWGFDSVISPAIDSIVRAPLFTYNFVRSYRQTERALDWFLDDDLWNPATGRLMPLLRQLLGRDVADKAEAVRVVEAIVARTGGRGARMLEHPGIAWRVAEDLGLDDVLAGGFDDWYRALRDLAATGRRAADDLGAATANLRHAQDLMRDVSLQRALESTIPFIDDHHIRSQFQVWARNITPFWFAEEQFLKRWVRTFRHSPEALRKAQLTYMGLQSGGVIRPNDRGEDVFMYYGTPAMTAMFSKVVNNVPLLNRIFGTEMTLPIASALTGTVKYALPGFDRLAVPQVGPLVAIGLDQLAHRFPELNEARLAILGERGADRGIVRQLVPTSVMRFYDASALAGGPERNRRLAAYMVQAMAIADANGLTPDDDATEYEIEEFMERVEDHARLLLLMGAIVGFVGPSSPQVTPLQGDPLDPAVNIGADFTFADLGGEYVALMRNLGPEEGTRLFLERHPDASAFTVFETDKPSGAPLPATNAALDFMEANAEWLDQFPRAGAWLLPPSDGSDPFAQRAYYTQTAKGLRVRKDPRQFYDDMKFAAAADDYFESKRAYDTARANADADRKRELDQSWGAWKAAYMAQHPLFQRQLEDPAAHHRRVEVLRELRLALGDPARPEVPHETLLRQVLESYDAFVTRRTQLRFNRTARGRRLAEDNEAAFVAWGEQFVATNPSVRAFWRSVIVPEAGVSLTDADAEGILV